MSPAASVAQARVVVVAAARAAAPPSSSLSLCHSAVIYAAIVVIVVIAAHSDSSRARAAPTAAVAATASSAPLPASEASPHSVAATAATATATTIAEPDPRPAALHAPRHAMLTLHGEDTMSVVVVAAAATAAAATATGLASGTRVDNVTRLHGGDVFNAYDAESCITDTCVGLSSGTAGLFHKNDLNDARKYRPDAVDCRCQCLPHLSTFREDLNICVDDVHECTLAPFVSGSTSEKIPFVFLPLRGQIIYPSKEISFQGVKSPICAVSGAQYLTTTGWMDLRNPIDADVPFRLFRDEGRTFLQWLGEADLRNKMQGRLVLVHLMCRDMSMAKSTGHVAPEDTTGYATGQSALVAAANNQNIFSPCVAIRIVGQPVKMTNNVTEVSFQPETQTTAITSTIGLSTKEYVAITICSLLLGLVYVASVLLYLYVKKRKSGRLPNGGDASATIEAGGTTAATINEQVTFGAGFSRTSSLQSGGFGGKIRDGNSFIGDPRRESLRMHQHAAAAAAAAAAATSTMANGNNMAPPGYGRHSLPPGNGGLTGEDHGVVKNNPLLKHFPIFDGPPEFPSDMSNSNSECGDDELQHQHHQRHPVRHQRLHGHDIVDGLMGGGAGGKKTNTLSYSEGGDEYDNDAAANSGGDETECLPEENVSIVEDHLSVDDKLENMKAIVNGTLRRKLYFNPAYFEPHLLMSPPAAAIEFLNKIREVISIAKYKMSTKRYQPSLVMIPEEGGGGHNMRHGTLDTATPTESEAYQLHGINRTGGVQTPQSSQLSRCKSSASSGTGTSCVGCPGCAAHSGGVGDAMTTTGGHNNRADCRNCGDKRNSIRKWLEDVSTHEGAHQRDGGVDAADGGDNDEHNILEKLLDMPLLDSLAETERKSEKRGADSSGSDTDTIKANSLDSKRSQKRMAPAPPGGGAPAPKIISHYLKQEISKPNVNAHNEQQQLEINNNNHNMMRNSKNTTTAFGEATMNNKIYDKMELFTQLTQTAVVGELFNNPQFKHHPPYAPVVEPSVTAAATSDYDVMRSLKQHMPDMIYEAMAKDYSKRKIITNQQQQHQPAHHHHHGAAVPMQVPHPDYDDGSLSKKYYYDIPAYVHVPTPDYHTFGRSKNNPQPDSPIYKRKSPHHLIVDYETDSLERNSTAHRRHSRQHTPATTPGTTLKRPTGGNASSSSGTTPTNATTGSGTTTTTTTGSGTSGSSEASSQPSPSLSTALPLEEEVEIRHTMVYDRAEGYRKDGEFSSRISFANLLQQQQHPQNGLSRLGGPPALPAKQPRIQYNTPSHGSMTIEVEHSPSEYELSTDSEQFEPDTLDRKAARRASVNSRASGGAAIVNLWSQHLTKAGIDAAQTAMRHSSLENIASLPADVIHHQPSLQRQLQHSQQQERQPQLVLRSSGSFKSNSLSNFAALNVPAHAEPRLQKNFNSLREIYEAKNLLAPAQIDAPKTGQQSLSNAAAAALEREREMGRLLTLEARHSRRQRQTGGTGGTLKKPVPPDVVPNGSAHNTPMSQSNAGIYDRPKTPAKPSRPAVASPSSPLPPTDRHHFELYQTNLTAWSANTGGSGGGGGHSSQHTSKSRGSTTSTAATTTSATTNTTATTSDDGDRDGDFDAETRSNSSESTEVTGVSDTQPNSDSDAVRRMTRRQRRAGAQTETPLSAAGSQQSSAARKYSKVNKTRPPPPSAPAQPPIDVLKNFMSVGGALSGAGGELSDFSDTSTIKSGSTNFLYQSTARKSSPFGSELDQIEIVSSKSLSVHSVPLSRDQGNCTPHSDYEPMQAQQPLGEANNNDVASINHEQLLYDLTSPGNHFNYAQQQQQQQATKVFRCEVNPSSHGMQIALGLKDRVKKTKDLKYAWKRFVNIATSKFHVASGSSPQSGSGSTSPKSTTMILDDRLSTLSDGDEGISSIHDDSLLLTTVVLNSGSKTTTSSSATAQQPSGHSSGQVSRTPSCNSARSGRPAAGVAARHDPDSGYMSADSNESKLNSKRLYERFNFRGSRTSTPTADIAAAEEAPAVSSHKRMQDITEATSELEPQATQSTHQKPSVTGFIPKRAKAAQQQQTLIEPIEVNVFSSDDERYSSDDNADEDNEDEVEDEDDDDDDEDEDEDGVFGTGLDDDLCGSGAESVETNSVFFKNVRKAPAPPPPKQ